MKIKISITTSTLYDIPFQEALSIYRLSGFNNIELNMYWKGGNNWEVSQHLKNIEPHEVLNIISKSDLKLLSIHDCGGVIEHGKPSAINPIIHKYLNADNNKIPFLVFHVPHIKNGCDINWWDTYKRIFEYDLSIFNPEIVCIENLPQFEGYFVPLQTPEELYEFLCKNNLYSNLDVTHYAEMNVNIKSAIEILKNKIKTVHLSNYKNGRSHLSIRDGELNIEEIISSFDKNITDVITLEINIPSEIKKNKGEIINFLNEEKRILENMINK